jgi:hypothetical protein
MQLPPLQGNLVQPGFFIYAAGDYEYFRDFGPALIHSIQQNTRHGIHLHLYNPTPDQVQYCRNQERVSVTFESAPAELFDQSASAWATLPADPVLADRYRRITTAMKKGNDVGIRQRIQRTYFACARFIRLAQLIQPISNVFAIDIDAVVRQSIPELSNQQDVYIHHIEGKKARFLAGGVYLPGTNRGYDFLQKYADTLKSNILNDQFYWGIDQDVLDHIVPQYHWAQLPMELIDWEMQDSSCVWTAKGTRKNLDVFKNEQKRYNS